MFCWGGGRDPAHKWKCLTAFTWPCYRIFLTPDQIQQLSVSLCLSFSKHSTYLSSNKSLKTDFILQIIATTAHCAVDWSDTEKARSNPALCCVHKYPIQLIIKIIILLLLLLKNYHPTYITKYRREEYKKKKTYLFRMRHEMLYLTLKDQHIRRVPKQNTVGNIWCQDVRITRVIVGSYYGEFRDYTRHLVLLGQQIYVAAMVQTCSYNRNKNNVRNFGGHISS